MTPWLVPIIWAAVCWLFSLRRTPFAVLWAAISTFAAGIGALITEAAATVHHTVPGLVAAMIAACVLPTLFTFGTEITYHDFPDSGAIGKWRKAHRGLRLPRVRADRWHVDARPTDEGVALYVVRPGAPSRHIGTADPLADMDTFMEMRVRADQAAETLNALKIGSV